MRKSDPEIMRENIDLVNRALNSQADALFPIINESQYKWIELNEEMHYPSNMDAIYDTVWENIKGYIPKTLVGTVQNVPVDIENPYFKRLTVSLCPYFYTEKDAPDLTYYTGQYITNPYNIENGKVVDVVIKLNYPVKNGLTAEGFVHTALVHELTHLYDDAMSRKNNPSASISMKNTDRIASLLFNENGNPVSESIAQMLYLYTKSEEKAFLAQAVNELKEIGCDIMNYREKMKLTSLYRNISIIKDNTEKVIKAASEADLLYVNNVALYASSSLPKMPVREFDETEYKQKLVDFSEKICHEYLKKYYSIVYFYLNRWKKPVRVGKPSIKEEYYYL